MFIRTVVVACVLCFGAVAPGGLGAHCEIPCGIYDDAARFTELREHLTTIEKSMVQIKALAVDPGGNANQLARWVVNKEQHAAAVIDVVSQYFLTQRIKAPAADADPAAYHAMLATLHGIIVHAMKAKQTTDIAHVETLRSLLDVFEAQYAAR
ncbi:MAG: superoxide dismutase [Ni] [Planctomycetota bacterium]